MSHAQKIEDLAKRRQEGMSAEAQARLDKANEEADDWSARCQACGQLVKGTLAKIREHECAQTG